MFASDMPTEGKLGSFGSSKAIDAAVASLRAAYEAKLAEHAQALQDAARATIREKESQIQALEETVQKLMEENGRLTVERNQLLLQVEDGRGGAEKGRVVDREQDGEREHEHTVVQEHRAASTENALSVDDLELSARYAFSSSQGQAAVTTTLPATLPKFLTQPSSSILEGPRIQRTSPLLAAPRSLATDLLSEIDASLAKHQRSRDRGTPTGSLAVRSRASRRAARHERESARKERESARKERKAVTAQAATATTRTTTAAAAAATNPGSRIAREEDLSTTGGGREASTAPFIRVHRTGSIDLHNLPVMAAAAASATAASRTPSSAVVEEKAESPASRLHASGLEFFREARRRLTPDAFESVLESVSPRRSVEGRVPDAESTFCSLALLESLTSPVFTLTSLSRLSQVSLMNGSRLSRQEGVARIVSHLGANNSDLADEIKRLMLRR